MQGDETEDKPDELRYSTYLAHRQILIQTETDQMRSFDKSILSVSAGALALSITFSEKIASDDPVYSWLLYISWLIFCACILATTLSFLLAAHASARQREYFDNSFASNAEGPEPTNPFSALIIYLNVCSLALIFVGTLCLTTFAIMNFERRSQARHVQITATQLHFAAPSGLAECTYSSPAPPSAEAGWGPASPDGSKTSKKAKTP